MTSGGGEGGEARGRATRRRLRILFLSHYFPPEVNAPASRTFEHCRVWARDGHDVTVVTCVPNHPQGVIYPGYRNRIFQSEQRDGIRVIRLLTYVTANEGFLKRTLNYVFYLVAAVLAAPFIPKADIIVSTSPQFFAGLAGYPVSRLKRAPWVLEVRDLWPESILAVGAIRNRRVIAALHALERFAYRKAQAIVAVTEAFVGSIAGSGGSPKKITVIKNGVDLTQFTPLPRDNPFAREHGLNGKFVAGYLGTLGMAHGLDTVLQAAERLREMPDILFVLVGDGAMKRTLEAKAAAMGLTNLLLLPQQPKAVVPQVWASLDASLVLLRNDPAFLKVIPSKMFESMAMERPVILGVRGESAELLSASGGGVAIEPENAGALADAVLQLRADRHAGVRMGGAARRFVLDNFDRNRLAGDYERLLCRIVEEPDSFG